MPAEEDLAGIALLLDEAASPLFLALCFLWVDFMAPFSLPVLSIFELEPWVGVAAVDAGVGEACCEALSCAKAAPLMMVQPATMARISFVLRMTNLSWNFISERLGFVAAKPGAEAWPLEDRNVFRSVLTLSLFA
jgi:hypothetical protein